MAKQYLKNTASMILGLFAANTLIDFHAQTLAQKQDVNGKYYNWKHGRIFYRVKGTGSPVLLIHNLGHRSASYEWNDILHHLSVNHRVYVLDLPGCGRSDKPNFVYTAYLYVQLLKDFTNDIIGEKPAVVASNDSTPIAVVTNFMYKNLFSKIVLINPKPVLNTKTVTSPWRMTYMKLITLPVLGTAIYNVENFSYNAFLAEPLHIKLSDNARDHALNAYIVSHLQHSKGKYLHASKVNHYLNVNIKKMLTECDNVNIIVSKGLSYAGKTTNSFITVQPKTNIIKLDSKSNFPHMAIPGKTLSALRSVI